jgi:hypothetical protein
VARGRISKTGSREKSLLIGACNGELHPQLPAAWRLGGLAGLAIPFPRQRPAATLDSRRLESSRSVVASRQWRVDSKACVGDSARFAIDSSDFIIDSNWCAFLSNE